MKVGVIGLGHMGGPIAHKFYRENKDLVVFDSNPAVRQLFSNAGLRVAHSIEELSDDVEVIWVMVPDKVVDSVLEHLCACINPHTVIIDGGNSHFNDTERRAAAMNAKGLAYLDCGTSGGLWGWLTACLNLFKLTYILLI